ncbi:MAG: SH3 domain-containing protein [Holosporaceae bacterium]|nr:SH3 domain-containing protein [Holosporaceae bacterium]
MFAKTIQIYLAVLGTAFFLSNAIADSSQNSNADGANASGDSFVSVKSPEVNLRVGPGLEYPVVCILKKAGLPAKIAAEFGEWIKIKLSDGTEGWIKRSMVSRKNTAIVVVKEAILYRYSSDSQPIARIEKNVIVKALKKDKGWIKIEVNKIKGWIKKEDLWGVDENSIAKI